MPINDNDALPTVSAGSPVGGLRCSIRIYSYSKHYVGCMFCFEEELVDKFTGLNTIDCSMRQQIVACGTFNDRSLRSYA